jgi:hypothetical protein
MKMSLRTVIAVASGPVNQMKTTSLTCLPTWHAGNGFLLTTGVLSPILMTARPWTREDNKSDQDQEDLQNLNGNELARTFDNEV